MNKIQKIILSLVIVFLSNNVVTAEEGDKAPKAALKGPAEFQKVIDDYKAYVAKIPPEIRDEVIEYRKKIAKLNKEKRALYRELSQASQNYLKKEQQYKKKLPLKRKSLINIEKVQPKKAAQ